MSDPQSSSQGSDRAVEHDKVSEPETTTPHDAIASTASSAEPAIISTSAAKNDIASSEDQDIVPVEAAASSSTAPPVAGLKRMQSEALGPAFEDAPLQSTAAATSTILLLTLQLTTGARHPYKIDEKYLTNRKVEAKTDTGEFDPRELSGYKLKELIWTDWRTEWEPRPTNPSSIRLIFMGKLLEDKKPLKGMYHALTQWSGIVN